MKTEMEIQSSSSICALTRTYANRDGPISSIAEDYTRVRKPNDLSRIVGKPKVRILGGCLGNRGSSEAYFS
jgi:hypothetical protein